MSAKKSQRTKSRSAKAKATPLAQRSQQPKPLAQPKKARRQVEPKAKRLSALDAAAQMLDETGEPMSCQELIEAMAGRGYWTSPAGKRSLPSGTVLDGELVLLSGRVPDLEAMLARHQLARPEQIRRASQEQPVTYVVFDLLYHEGRSLLGQPLTVRRECLQRLVAALQEPRLVFSEGVIGAGKTFFEEAVRQGQEGVMAKHLASSYLPGKRLACWRKIKPKHLLPVVIIGWIPGRQGVGSLLVAALREGVMRYVANVRTGFTTQQRSDLARLLESRRRSRPVVPCPHRGLWVCHGSA
jgi:ATP-dependent DNA ligase